MLRSLLAHFRAPTALARGFPVRYYKKGLHPRSYDLQVVMSDGSMFRVRSSMRKDFHRLSEDTKNVKPWKHGEARMLDSKGQVSTFSKKFGAVIGTK